jgi:hypothetical protein
MKKFLFFCSLISLICVKAQNANDNFWSGVKESNIKLTGKRQIIPQKYLTVQLNGTLLKDKLFSAPNENNVKINESTCIITLPLPNGKMQQFRVVESPIMEPALADAYPGMKTFSIKGIDDVYANGKLDWNDFGFHGMVRTVNGDFFIDPYCVGNISDYITYYTADFVKDPSQRIPEVGVIKNTDASEGAATPKKKEQSENEVSSAPASCIGTQLRKYRLAIACTGEYAVAATGLGAPTVAQTLAKIVTSVNRVTGVYETEVAIRLILVATETLVVYTNAGTDPFTGNNNANTLINQSQTVITASIGSANFDIGHTFSTGAGGLAGLGVVCNNSLKANGVTGSGSPVGDPYDIDYVAHEVGHQFGGNHTFNATTGSCSGNRNASTSMEPGSGVTIMAYAGICTGNNIANNSIPYFHAISFDEIVNYSSIGAGNSCAVTQTTGNQIPIVTGGASYTVPKSTAFILTGSATDPDGDALVYSWEEYDAGASAGNWNSGNRPYFRSYTPTTTPTRSFPSAAVVATGNYTNVMGEYAPPTVQTLKFRLTARDNKANGGGVCYTTSSVVISSAGPFNVVYPDAAGITWLQNSQENITWNVNGTDASPVSCDTVRILISYNGGGSYSVLLNSTPNDGSQLIPVPTVTTLITTCRIKVEGKGNIFYDISDNNFAISTTVATVGLRKNSQNNPAGLYVWPNPFNNEFNLIAGNLSGTSATTLKIVDVLGKTVLLNNYNNVSELKEIINLTGVSRGVYFVSITNNDKHSVYRIVKE